MEEQMPEQDEMEDVPPPEPPEPGVGDPRPASTEDIAKLRAELLVTKSIAGAAALFRKACDGGDTYENNCAHYLSDAFLRAGYTELAPPSACINARCGTVAKRPVRARDMWCWFKEMKKEERSTLPKNEGFWAVFQLKEDEYWGGHVVIIDTDTGVYYGTGNYPQWNQHAYKW
jgi:hypothetical protein